MKKNQLNHCLIYGTLGFIILFSSCKKEAEITTTTSTTAYENGVFITNEGKFGEGTGTVSFFNRSTKTVSNDLFQNINGRPLGNVLQSMEVFNNKGYLLVNNGSKIEVVTMTDFKESGVIKDLIMPRYFLGIDNNKAYVSQWGTGGIEGSIKVINLNDNTISKTISTGKGPEVIVKVGNSVYVANSGGFANDSTVSIISTIDDSVIKTLVVGYNPNSLQVDANGKIWVLCVRFAIIQKENNSILKFQ